MKTFREYAADRELAETTPNIGVDIAKAGNDLARKNPKVVPGLTPVRDIKTALTSDPGVEKLVQKDPTSAGAVGAYLGGPDAVKQLGVKS